MEIKHLATEDLRSALEIEGLCFGKFWSIEAYQRELESPNSDLVGLWLGETEEGTSEKLSNRAGTGAPPLQSFDIFTPPLGAHKGVRPLQIPPTLIGLGCLWAILEEAHITMLAIHPEFQGRGFGQALLWALLKSACDRQLERATLEVRASNLAAVSLYKKFGFKEAGRRKRYYEDTGEDAVVMWLSGLEKPEFQVYLESERQKICDRIRQKN